MSEEASPPTRIWEPARTFIRPPPGSAFGGQRPRRVFAALRRELFEPQRPPKDETGGYRTRDNQAERSARSRATQRALARMTSIDC